MNKQIFVNVGITEEEYKVWCKENKKPSYKASTKQEFFSKIQSGELTKKDGKIISRG